VVVPESWAIDARFTEMGWDGSDVVAKAGVASDNAPNVTIANDANARLILAISSLLDSLMEPRYNDEMCRRSSGAMGLLR
jgi:hypothetical protein